MSDLRESSDIAEGNENPSSILSHLDSQREKRGSVTQSSPIVSSMIQSNLHEDEDDEGEDLIEGDNMLDDYRAIPELDTYEGVDLDSSEYEAMSIDARREIEQRMESRDQRGRVNRMEDIGYAMEGATNYRPPAALRTPSDGLEAYEDPRARIAEHAASGRVDEDYEEINLEDFAPPLGQWIARESTRYEIKRRFRSMLTEFCDDNGPIYARKINDMCSNNGASLVVSYLDLSQACPTLGIWLADCPKQMIEIFDEEARSVVMAMFPDYDQVHPRIHVRISGLPVRDSLRDLRRIHLDVLIRVYGVVTRRSSVFPQLQSVKYNCSRCGFLIGPILVNDENAQVAKPSSCVNCEAQSGFTINSHSTIYRNYQKISIQESPGTVPAGRVPRTKEVILMDDLRDSIKPGEIIDVTGIYCHSYDAMLNAKHGFPVFSTIIEANYIGKPKQEGQNSLTDEDISQILEYSKKPNIGSIIAKSIAPSIFGHEDIKMAVALSLFGGVCKTFPSLHRIRGDINVLLLGDPGTAKSQFLKYAEKTSDRAVFTTGKGASAVGLTASVRKDMLTHEWTLEGGAFVLADQGVCLIDEFDKMNDQDRTSIHEAMEQQSISISKAGIVATLQARCSVIAAANPISGRYDSSVSFAENVDLTPPILSRFDILCVVRDTVDPIIDSQLALHVVQNHIKSHPAYTEKDEVEIPEFDDGSDCMDQALLRKYIRYARQHIQPKLLDLDKDKVANLYSELREQSERTGGIPITPRHVESVVRMSEAHAKMHLREYVNADDVDMAVRVMLQSFIGAQKFQIKKQLSKRFQKYLTYKRDSDELLFYVLKGMFSEAVHAAAYAEEEYADPLAEQAETRKPIEILISDFAEKAKEYGIYRLDQFYSSNLFKHAGFQINPSRRVILKDRD